jgi:CheY-like chemotaxis protein
LPAPNGSAQVPVLAEQRPLRILLAEDNAVNQKVTLGQLARLGYRADLAANGLEVLHALERQSYDVVLMDVQMPEMDGLEATRRIVARWSGAQRPWIVAVTAHAMAGDREQCISAGMDDYLVKPIRLEELVAVLGRTGRAATPAEAAAEPADQPPAELSLDAEQIARVRGEIGDEVFGEMLELFARDAPARIAAAAEALAAGDADRLRKLAHALKGDSGYVGAAELRARAAELEALARGGSLADAGPAVERVRAAYARFTAALAAAAAR